MIGAIAGAAVLLGEKLVSWYLARRKAAQDDQKLASELSLTANEQALRVYKDIVEGLRADMAALVEHARGLDQQVLELREERVLLKKELEILRQNGDSAKK